MSKDTPRYALYFAPAPESALWRFGSRTIGYDAATGEEIPPAAPPGLNSIDWFNATAEPRRYGFHATLKAPFILADGRSEAELVDSLAGFSRCQAAVSRLRLEVAALGAFIALVPGSPNAALQDFAFRVVEAFESFRAPLAAADRERRLAAPLTTRQVAHLDRYGYPYVGPDFRFHMTLTGRLATGRIEPVRAALAEAHADQVAAGEVDIDQIVLYRQSGRADRFRIIARFPLAVV